MPAFTLYLDIENTTKPSWKHFIKNNNPFHLWPSQFVGWKNASLIALVLLSHREVWIRDWGVWWDGNRGLWIGVSDCIPRDEVIQFHDKSIAFNLITWVNKYSYEIALTWLSTLITIYILWFHKKLDPRQWAKLRPHVYQLCCITRQVKTNLQRWCYVMVWSFNYIFQLRNI